MKYQVLVLDLDGTLTNSKKEITEPTRKALIEIQQEGRIVVLASGRPINGVVPLAEELDLKKAAKAAGFKSVAMIHQKELEPLTGYIHGGCSPVGMKKQFPTFIDESAVLLESIFVSGGRIGLQIKISPDDLAGAVEAKFTALCSER